MANIIKKAYNSAEVKFIGTTANSKILHLFNPELFVMWDEDIRKNIRFLEVQQTIRNSLRRLRKN